MSLIISGNSNSEYSLLPEDTYPAICDTLVDIGMQYSEQFGKASAKVIIGWAIPSEEMPDGGFRRISQTYTASTADKANLRKMLVSWRGRDFTPEEIDKFNLRNIVGAPCLLQIIHKTNKTGKTYAVVSSVMKLPKGMSAPKLSEEPTVFDLEQPDALTAMLDLPQWMQDRIKESDTYKQMAAEEEYRKQEQEAKREPAPAVSATQTTFTVDDDEDGLLPF